ncbi:MAG TPA: hypothetical protein ENI13_01785, partial [candidate division CPR3 bacterium]|nr:hypothetical protein [candidate division CPR3 bacterium]
MSQQISFDILERVNKRIESQAQSFDILNRAVERVRGEENKKTILDRIASVGRQAREGFNVVAEAIGIRDEVEKFFEPTEQVRMRDFIREVPEGIQLTARNISQGVLRELIAVGTSAGIFEEPGKRLFPDFEAEFIPKTKLQRQILGTDRPVSFESVGREYLSIVGLEEGAPKIAAIPLGVLFGSLNFIVGGVSKNVLDDIARIVLKSTDETFIGNTLKQAGLRANKQELATITKSLARTTNPTDTIRIVDDAFQAQVLKREVAPSIAKSTNEKSITTQLKRIISGTDEEIESMAATLKNIEKTSEVSKFIRSAIDNTTRIVSKRVPKSKILTKAAKEATSGAPDAIRAEARNLSRAVDESSIEALGSIGKKEFDTVEEFVKAKGIDIDSVVIKDTKNLIVENAAFKDAVLTDIPISSFEKPKFETLAEIKPKPGRKITDPIEATLVDGKLRITDGANRFTQAVANGDETIPVVLEIQKGGKVLSGKALIDEVNRLIKAETSTLDVLRTQKAKVKAEEPSLSRIAPEIEEHRLNKREVSSLTDTTTKEIDNVKEAVDNFQEFDLSDSGKGLVLTEKEAIRQASSNAPKYKDISGFKGQARDVFRNFEEVFGADFKMFDELILEPFEKAKGGFVKEQIGLLNLLDENVVKKFGFKKRSKESAAIMDLGEKVRTFDDIAKEFGVEKANNIAESERWFRGMYDQLLDEINLVRSEIWPHNPEKLIPKRDNYFRHWKDMEGDLQAILNAFETPAGISPSLEGVSPFTKPKGKFLGFAQRRLGVTTERDAIGGFLNYTTSFSYAKHMDPTIPKFRTLAKELAAVTEESKNINNFIRFLHNFSNDLAGKTHGLDRFVQEVIPGGRKTFRVLDFANKRAKANVILGNISASIAQIFNVPQGIASAKQYSIHGIKRTLADIFTKSEAMAKSNFLNERYSESIYRKFDTGWLRNSKNFAAWMVTVLDEVGTKFIWNSHYEKGLALGLDNPVRYADGITRKMVAGRGIGE